MANLAKAAKDQPKRHCVGGESGLAFVPLSGEGEFVSGLFESKSLSAWHNHPQILWATVWITPAE